LPDCPFEKMLASGQRASLQITMDQRWYEVTVDPIFSAAGEITGAVHIVSDITESRAAEERYRLLVDNLPVVTWQSDEHGKTHFISHVSTKIEGYTPEEIYAGGEALWFDRIHPDDQRAVSEAFKALFADGAVYDVQYRIKHKAGHWIWLHDFAFATSLQNGIKLAHGVFSDVSARKQAEDERDQLEMQLRQAQKMEAIGHLAGGIAHDFNNLLTPIMGYAEMAVASVPDRDPLVPRLAGIISAARKAKDLTQQLLSFGRRQSIITQVIDLNEVILSFNDIMRRTIRESIRIDLLLDPEGSCIKADRSQIEQIILNMTVNAQDAFNGAHGRINIETCRVWMDGENARMHPGMAPGEYVLLSFRDNGCGMSAEVVSHIFEPFFTTKRVGHGTGLGLATVYGIVKQHNAHISVISHEGEGTVFTIYFPCCDQAPLFQPQVTLLERSMKSGEATILVVEDNEMVREMVREMLEGVGYAVITAPDPLAAIDLLEHEQCRANINLLVSDVVMPGMNGPELYEQLVVRIPSLKVIYISGYPLNPSSRGASFEDEIYYLQKPFTAEALLERIRQVL
jgi:PAS domain S-box-containing protein